MEKLKVLKLSVELTRRCNMNCPHCFKGDAQNIDLENRYIDKLFSFVSEVNVLHITGGEPSLNVDGLKYTIQTIRTNNVKICRLDVICNGRTNTTAEFFTLLEELNAMTLFPEKSKFSVSVDIFHGTSGNSSIKNFFDGFREFKKIKNTTKLCVYPYYTCNYPPIMAIGRAQNMATAVSPDDANKVGPTCFFPVVIHGNVIDWLYINANGIISVDGNQSYQFFDNPYNYIGHITDYSNIDELLTGIRAWNAKKDVRIRGTLFDIGRQILVVCKECPAGKSAYIKKLQFVKTILVSEEFQEYPDQFKNSKFISMLNDTLAEYPNIIPNSSLRLEDCYDCKWWEFDHLENVVI